jgi:HSP20 family molecular chaperone IbpA
MIATIIAVCCISASAFQPTFSSSAAYFPLKMFDGECDLMPRNRRYRTTFSTSPFSPFGSTTGSIIKAFLDEEQLQPRVYRIASNSYQPNPRRNTFKIDYIEQSNGNLEITADLPGYSEVEIEIEIIEDNKLMITVSKDSKVGEIFNTKEELNEDGEAIINLDAPDSMVEDSSKVVQQTPESKLPQTVYRERNSFQGSRTIQLPKDMDESNISANLANGVLTVSIPRLPAKEPLKRFVKIST